MRWASSRRRAEASWKPSDPTSATRCGGPRLQPTTLLEQTEKEKEEQERPISGDVNLQEEEQAVGGILRPGVDQAVDAKV
mmetsp:Transcript_124783/g.399853  ORF Transcript_124783/g.399853 Transcript_124783/m.399853 type:complete len:80 (-) Transcript_124783:95-334(-)